MKGNAYEKSKTRVSERLPKAIGPLLLAVGRMLLSLTIYATATNAQEGYFARDAYARGLYHDPEPTNGDLAMVSIFGISGSAGLVLGGTVWTVRNIGERKKNGREE